MFPPARYSSPWPAAIGCGRGYRTYKTDRTHKPSKSYESYRSYRYYKSHSWRSRGFSEDGENSVRRPLRSVRLAEFFLHFSQIVARTPEPRRIAQKFDDQSRQPLAVQVILQQFGRDLPSGDQVGHPDEGRVDQRPEDAPVQLRRAVDDDERRADDRRLQRRRPAGDDGQIGRGDGVVSVAFDQSQPRRADLWRDGVRFECSRQRDNELEMWAP